MNMYYFFEQFNAYYYVYLINGRFGIFFCKGYLEIGPERIKNAGCQSSLLPWCW